MHLVLLGLGLAIGAAISAAYDERQKRVNAGKAVQAYHELCRWLLAQLVRCQERDAALEARINDLESQCRAWEAWEAREGRRSEQLRVLANEVGRLREEKRQILEENRILRIELQRLGAVFAA